MEQDETAEEESSEMSEDELLFLQEDVDDCRVYNPYSTMSAKEAQLEYFLRLNEPEKSDEIPPPPPPVEDQNEAKLVGQSDDETAISNGGIDSSSTTTTSTAGKQIGEKRRFLSKFGWHWPGGSSSNSSKKNTVVSTTTTTKGGIIIGGSGDKKKDKTKKDDVYTMWGSPEDRLIGDFSQPYALPTIMGLHPDLKSITPSVIIRLFKGIYEEEVESFRLLDCRYPYEYEGGHIRSALNIYTREQIAYLLHGKAKDVNGRRNILVFYCEFSSERAPSLCRFLRDEDRKVNKDFYPKLNYPEVYLLAGGYKKFFADYPTWCIPQGYKPMLHPDNAHELHYFRMKSRNFYTGSENQNFENTSRSKFYNSNLRL